MRLSTERKPQCGRNPRGALAFRLPGARVPLVRNGVRGRGNRITMPAPAPHVNKIARRLAGLFLLFADIPRLLKSPRYFAGRGFLRKNDKALEWPKSLEPRVLIDLDAFRDAARGMRARRNCRKARAVLRPSREWGIARVRPRGSRAAGYERLEEAAPTAAAL